MVKLNTRCIAAAVALFLLAWIALLYATLFVGDWKEEEVRLFSYLATKDEYLAAVAGLLYESTPRHGFKSGERVGEAAPQFTTLRELFHAWPPDDTSSDAWLSSPCHPSKGHACALPRFDFQSASDMAQALQYRTAERPFVVFNVPELDAAISSAFTMPALLRAFGSTPRIVEKSADQQFLYYSTHISLDANLRHATWSPPQTELPLTFSRFLRLAQEAEEEAEEREWRRASSGAEARKQAVRYPPLHYLTVNAGEGGHTPWLTAALPIFSRPQPESFFIVDRAGYKGINCRYGMRGVAAAAHYDGQRNFVAMLRGRKRYVLLPPSECDRLSLLPKGHPSARHTDFEWGHLGRAAEEEAVRKSDPALAAKHEAVLGSRATEYVLAMGEVLYLPSHWFHYIVSQDASVQCNARSGASADGQARAVIKKCMAGRASTGVERESFDADPQWVLEN